MQASVHFNPKDMAKFSAAMDELSKQTRKEMPVLLKEQAVFFVRNAISSTPLAKKEVRVVWDFLLQKIVSAKRGRLPSHQKAYTKTPKGRGFARAGWVRAMRQGLQKSSEADKWAWGQAPAFGYYAAQLTGHAPVIELGNDVPYILVLDRGGKGNKAADIEGKALRKTTYFIEKRLSAMAQRLQSRWKTSAF